MFRALIILCGLIGLLVLFVLAIAGGMFVPDMTTAKLLAEAAQVAERKRAAAVEGTAEVQALRAELRQRDVELTEIKGALAVALARRRGEAVIAPQPREELEASMGVFDWLFDGWRQ